MRSNRAIYGVRGGFGGDATVQGLASRLGDFEGLASRLGGFESLSRVWVASRASPRV